MNTDTLNRIYDVLVEEAGATEEGSTGRRMFLTSSEDWSEYRFGGALGMGGKVWHQTEHRWTEQAGVIEVDRFYVNCYSEDLTPEREENIDRTNARLAQLEMD